MFRSAHSLRRLVFRPSVNLFSAKTSVVDMSQCAAPVIRDKKTGTARATGDATLSVTDAAVRQMQRLVKNSEVPHALRVGLKTGGCQGFEYEFSWVPSDTANDSEDAQFSRDGTTVLVRRKDLEVLGGSTVDYNVRLQAKTFVISANPQAEVACSCGKSFALADL